jgi:ribosomal protein S18 acetylase RimI-like enzyme
MSLTRRACRHATSKKISPINPGMAQRILFLWEAMLMYHHLLLWQSQAWQFRMATSFDVQNARLMLLREWMNPMSVSRDNVLVVHDDEDGGMYSTTNHTTNLIGFGQIRPLSSSSSAPRLFSSLSPTPSSPSATHTASRYSELASLFVLPPYRHQGIGTAIVTELLRRYDFNSVNHYENQKSNDTSTINSLVLLTLRPTISFYERFGFHVMNNSSWNDYSHLPTTFLLEYKLGQFISALLGNEIVCMIRQQHQCLAHADTILPK